MPGGVGALLLENSQHDSSIKAKGRIEIINAGFYSFSFFFPARVFFTRPNPMETTLTRALVSQGTDANRSCTYSRLRCSRAAIKELWDEEQIPTPPSLSDNLLQHYATLE